MKPYLVLYGLFMIGIGFAFRAIKFGARALDEMLGDFKPRLDPILKIPIRE